MVKIKYYFDYDSLQFKRVEASAWTTLINFCVVLILALGIACLFTIGYSAECSSVRAKSREYRGSVPVPAHRSASAQRCDPALLLCV